ncbi:MAG: hypothetical protein AB7N76_17685 [Planctomycetota bacterium]
MSAERSPRQGLLSGLLGGLPGCLLGGALLLAGAPAQAQDENPDVVWTTSGSLRVRGLHLRNGTLASDLDPTTLNSLRISGRDRIDAAQSFLDTRLRLQLKATLLQEVSMLLAVEVGDITFGVKDAGGGLGTDGVIFENKDLYLEYHPTRYSFRVRGGLYPRESDPYGLILSNDVAGLHGEVELLGTQTSVYGDLIKAVESSRLDLDGDGVIDNDYSDRTIFLAGATNASLDLVAFESFFLADIDNSQKSQSAGAFTQDTYWLGLTARSNLGPAELSSTVIGAYGRRRPVGGNTVNIRGLAMHHQVTLQLPFVTVQGLFGWASGRDPKQVTTDEAFPVVTPFYGQSGIVYANFGGFNATGSDLSGTAHVSLKLRVSPLPGLDVEAVFLYAWYTSDRDVSKAVNQFNTDARDLGFEMDLNLTYKVMNGFKTFVRGSVLFTGKGYQVERDAHHRGDLGQVIVGAQLDF